MSLWQSRLRATISLAALFFPASSPAEIDREPPRIYVESTIGLSVHAPTLDGRVHDNEWSQAAVFDGFGTTFGPLERRRVRGYIAGDREGNLWFGIVSQLPTQGDLASPSTGSPSALHQDSVELWVDPAPDAPSHTEFQVLASVTGATTFQAHSSAGAKAPEGWEARWKTASGFHDGWWHFEAYVPAAALAANRHISEGEWQLNLCRDWKRPWSLSSLGSRDYRSSGARVRFRADHTPTVRQLHLTAPQSGRLQSVLEVFNPGPDAASVEARQILESDVGARSAMRKSISLKPGQTHRFTLNRADDAGRYGLSQLVIVSKRTIFERLSTWTRGPTNFQWLTTSAKSMPMDITFSYYPSNDRLRLLIDVSRVGKNVSDIRVTVRRAEGETIWSDVLLPGESHQIVREVRLPRLQGSYEILAEYTADGGRTIRSTQHFERKSLDGEGTALGRGTDVHAPFEPLVYAHPFLKASNRRYLLGHLGLWNQVHARALETEIERPILARPIRVLASVDGRKLPVAGSVPSISHATDASIALNASLTAGALHIDAHTQMSVDGMQWNTWTIQPTGSSVIDNLVLEIPVRADQARMLHAMADGLRDRVVAEALSQKSGVIWTASALIGQSLPKNWCSYAFIGNGSRGIAWFAENDKNWGWDEKTPNVEIVRSGNAVVLRVHLVNSPQRFSESRTLQFGLQVAPAKRRIDNWRYLWSKQKFSLLGTDINWLGGSSCGSLYPVDKDMFYWDSLRKANAHPLATKQLAEIVSRGLPYWRAYSAAQAESWEAHVKYNLGGGRTGTRMVFYYNRAASPIYDEWKTFQDEWSLTNYRDTSIDSNWNGHIPTVPSKSYNDIALHWYEKSFERGGNQGIYWDNWFIYGSKNTQMTEAYERDDGTVRPAAGMLQLRELSQRTFQWLGSRRASPIVTMPHMTSTNILPMMGFATFQLDWESHYGQGPVQERFSREYLQLVSTGELAGSVPVTLLGTPSAEAAYLRSDAAVRLVHELDVLVPYGRGISAIDRAVHEIVDAPGLQSFRYWDERAQPVAPTTYDILAINYVIPGKRALVGLCSWSSTARNVELSVNWKQLGLSRISATIRNVETGEIVKTRRGRLHLAIRPYDAVLLEFSASN